MVGRSGRHAGIAYYYEDAGFKAAPNDTTAKTFGANPTMDTKEGSHNAVRVFNPQSREAAQIIEQNFDGSWSVTFELTNPWWIRAVVADPGSPTDNADGSYTYSFTGDVPSSMQIIQPTEGISSEVALKGAVVASCSITNDVPGNPQVSLNGAYATEEEVDDGAGNLTSQPQISERALTHRDASLSVSGSTEARIQSVTLDIENNIDMIPELGSGEPVDYSPKVRAPSIDYSDIVQDRSEQERFYGGGGATTPQEKIENQVQIDLQWDNGKTGSSQNLIKFILSGAFPDTYSRENIGNPEEDLQGTLNEMIEGVTAEATNGTATFPA